MTQYSANFTMAAFLSLDTKCTLDISEVRFL